MRQSSAGSGGLSLEAAKFYARVYGSARNGSLADLRRAGCSEEEAEEVFSASFERIMATVDPIERGFAEAQMVVFVKRACHRRLIDERRHRAVIRQISLNDAHSLVDHSAEAPDEVAVEREAVAIGREALSELSEPERVIFEQRYAMQLSPAEILERTPDLTHRSYRKLIERANREVLAAFQRIDKGERCAELERQILARFAGGDCDDREAAAVEAHLAHCRTCRRAQARMRGYLHEVAGGAAVAAFIGGHQPRSLTGVIASAADLLGRGGEALAEATRALRERLRELVLRVGGAIPNPAGDTAIGQTLGASAVKVASACGVGVAAGACVAAGIVPGAGLVGQRGIDANPPPARSSQPLRTGSDAREQVTPAADLPLGSMPSLDSESKEDREVRSALRARRAKVLSAKKRRRRVAAPTRASGRQVGMEFGAEAAVPSSGSGSSNGGSDGEGDSSVLGGGAAARAGDGNASDDSGSGGGVTRPADGASADEFGF